MDPNNPPTLQHGIPDPETYLPETPDWFLWFLICGVILTILAIWWLIRLLFTEPKKTKPKEFIYKYANGTVISNDDTLKRIKSIGCPPAWRNVEINPNANAELGCTGYDTAGRKQWRYTRLHDMRIEKEKFCKLISE